MKLQIIVASKISGFMKVKIEGHQELKCVEIAIN